MTQGSGSLGMGCPMQRVDLLNGTPLPPGTSVRLAEEAAARASWDGFSGTGDYALANGNTHEAMRVGHGIRDEEYASLLASAQGDDEIFDCVIVGGGISGLAAAHTFTQRTEHRRRCLVLENHAIFGGEARRNEFIVDGQRLLANQGSALFFPPMPGSFIEKFYESIGFDGRPLTYQSWSGSGPDPSLATSSYIESGPKLGMFFGTRFGHPEGLWLTDPWGKQLKGAPFPEQVRDELLHAHNTPLTTPLPHADGDAVARRLDQISMETLLIESGGLSRETIRNYMPYAASGAGASADAISAYAEYAPDLLFPWREEEGSQMFPGGNTGIARLLVRALVPAALPGDASLHSLCLAPIDFAALDRARQPTRVRLGATVVWVQHDGSPESATTASVVYIKDGALRRVRAKAVVMAGGWTTLRVVHDLPPGHRDAYQQFHRMPCLIANVAVRHWRFISKLDITECQWFEGLGDSFAVRKVATFGAAQPSIPPDQPTVLTLKILYNEPGLPLAEQATRAECVCSRPAIRNMNGRFANSLCRCSRPPALMRAVTSRHHSQSLGTRVPLRPARLLLRAGGETGAPRGTAQCALRPDCLRELGSVRHDGSPRVNRRGRPCGEAARPPAAPICAKLRSRPARKPLAEATSYATPDRVNSRARRKPLKICGWMGRFCFLRNALGSSG